MFSYIANVPPEIWVYILREAVSPYWPNKTFFPPPDDLALINGFKKACSAFELLAEDAERLLGNEDVNVSDSGEILRSNDEDLIRIKRLVIKHKVTLADFNLFTSRCLHLVSLSLSFGLLGPQTVLVSHNLIRLDLVYEHIWWHAPTLDFPNLRELRLSLKNPLGRHGRPVYVPQGTNAERFAADLINTVRKLRSLKLLSAHIVLDNHRSATAAVRSIHRRHHAAFKDAPMNFTGCYRCIRYYRNNAHGYAEIVRSREAKLSVMLAENLPLLEKVMWMDTWNESYCDEEGMRESRIVRMNDGKILVQMRGAVVPPLKTFSLD
ncbi:hypothetical protein ACEPAI_3606 [Sanghuangporus weigelae]